MDLYELRRGDRVRTADGAVVEVLAETEDEQWVKVRYIESPDDPGLVDTEDLCHVDELQELIEPRATTP